ncbi:MAG: phosphoribosyltransferase [Candidatus Thorarchaeota archaeon]
MEYEIHSWEYIYNLTLRLSELIVKSGFSPELIVGIARGGWIPARILSDVLYNDQMMNVRIEYYTDVGARGKEPKIVQPIMGGMEGKRVLIVDEVADTGESLYHAIEHVKALGAKEIKSAVLHLKPTSRIIPDFYIVKTDKWTVYPWENRESIIALVKIFKDENPKLTPLEIRDKLVFEVGFDPAVVDYFIKRL